MGKFLTFYALVTLLPVLGAASIYWSGKLVGTNSAAQVLGPLAIQFAALLLTNKLLPNLTVNWRAALMGALVSGIAIEALKWGFLRFAKQMLLESYARRVRPAGAGAHGAAVDLPVAGCWSCWAPRSPTPFQNLPLLEAEERRQHGKEPINALVATQLLAAVAAHHERGGTGIDRDQLAKDFALSHRRGGPDRPSG